MAATWMASPYIDWWNDVRLPRCFSGHFSGFTCGRDSLFFFKKMWATPEFGWFGWFGWLNYVELNMFFSSCILSTLVAPSCTIPWSNSWNNGNTMDPRHWASMLFPRCKIDSRWKPGRKKGVFHRWFSWGIQISLALVNILSFPHGEDRWR